MAASSDLTLRHIAPEPDDDADETQMLYRPVPPPPDPKQFKVEFKWFSPKAMDDLLRTADSDPEFKQRPLASRDIQRWKRLIESERFVHFLPNGPLVFDEDGMLLNGKHRLTAGAGQDKKLGFMVVTNVPRWMFRFFDTPRQRTLLDVFHQSGRMTKAQTGSTLRLALRYEEYLYGLRPGTGWNRWAGERDEHADLDEFLTRRQDLADLYITADRAHRGCRLITASLMVFRFYQQLAWPAGADKVQEFWEGLTEGAMLRRGHPALTLREWGRDGYEMSERWPAKRETHLLLLFRMFGMFVAGETCHNIKWAYGFPMQIPYHPEGPETAVETVRKALAELNANPQ